MSPGGVSMDTWQDKLDDGYSVQWVSTRFGDSSESEMDLSFLLGSELIKKLSHNMAMETGELYLVEIRVPMKLNKLSFSFPLS